MEDSFRVRVDKIFGSLASASSSSSNTSLPLSSLWCLTDEEIERREWSRERGSADDNEPKPYPPNLDGFCANQPKLSSQTEPLVHREKLEAELEDLDGFNDDEDEDDDGEKGKQHRRGSSSCLLVKPEDHDDEEWDIRSSIGLDCTLDYEEEEDGHDKLAVGKAEAGDHLYMRDVTGYWTDINFYDELPNSFKDVTRDPRANHIAAKLRLKEDAEATGQFGSLQVSDAAPDVAKTDNKALVEVVNLKSIMKRKEKKGDAKLQKRVRFDPGCDNEYEEQSEGAKDVIDCCSEDGNISEASLMSQELSAVPDYIRNPSRYTHYAFDSSSDSDEESNQKAYMDFLNQLKMSSSKETEPVDTSGDLPNSVTFSRKTKPGDASLVKKSSEFEQDPEGVGKELMPKKGWPTCVAAGEAEESEVCAMEEDEPEKLSSSGKQARHYRTKGNNIGLEEPVT